MAFEKSSGFELLPPVGETRLLANRQELFFSVADTLKSEGLLRSLFWTLRLSIVTEGGSTLRRTVPGFRFASYGFMDPESEADAFGVIVIAAPSVESRIVREEQDFDGGGVTDFNKEKLESVTVDGQLFPIIVRRIREYLHAPFHPAGGSGACWCKPRQMTRGSVGILTAKHVLPGTSGGQVAIGQQVSLSCGHPGRVSALAPDGIDAAVVSSDCIPKSGSPIQTLQIPVPWMDVEFEGSMSSIATKITSVPDVQGVLTSPLLPARFFLANYGHPGDSGALVRDVNTQNAAGIYLGSFTNPAGGSGGIAQLAYQAQHILDIELYE